MAVDMSYSVEFETAIRGHIYKEKRTPGLGEKLSCVKDTGADAAGYDQNAIGDGVYLRNNEGKESGLVQQNIRL